MSNRVMYLLPALVLAILALVLAVVGLMRGPATPAEPAQTVGQAIETAVDANKKDAPTYDYWVVNDSLPLGHQLSKQDLTTLTSNVELSQAISAEEDLSGIELRRNVRAGSLLTKDDFDAVSLLTQQVPAGYRALAISVNDVIAAGGLLKPGDMVDVLASFRNAGDVKQPFVMNVLTNVQVLAVGDFVLDQVIDEKDKTKRRSGGTAVLAVPEDDVNKVLLFEKNATIQLAVLGNRGGLVAENAETEATEGDATAPAKAAANKPLTEAEKIKAQKLRVGMVTLEDVVPQIQPKKAEKAQAPVAKPAGHKVEIFEGGKSRSTHVQ